MPVVNLIDEAEKPGMPVAVICTCLPTAGELIFSDVELLVTEYAVEHGVAPTTAARAAKRAGRSTRARVMS